MSHSFLLFQISKRVMEITTFTIALISSLIKIPAITESLFSVTLDSNALLMNCCLSSHIPDNLEHVYNKCSTFSSWMPHILQIPLENGICLSPISVFIHPWKNFQLKSPHFLRIHTLIKFTWNHISQSIMAVKSLNLVNQYSLDRTLMSVLFSKILYISFGDKEHRFFSLPLVFGTWYSKYYCLLHYPCLLNHPILAIQQAKTVVSFVFRTCILLYITIYHRIHLR